MYLCTQVPTMGQAGSGSDNNPDPARINQEAETAYWQGFYFKFRLSDRLFYYQENHYRRINSLDNKGDFVGRMGQFYNRPGLVYLVDPSFEITVGPVITFRFSPDPNNEMFDPFVMDYRIWHQYVFNQKVGKVKLIHQFRIEHRWLRPPVVGSEFQFTNRWRYKISAYIPLNKPRMEDKTWYLYPSNEFFFENGDHKREMFEENRFYLAAGYAFGNWQLFAGYMHTYGPNQNVENTYRTRHIIRVNMMLNLDFRKKKDAGPKPLILAY